MKRGLPSKAAVNRKHFKKRLLERYNLTANRREIAELVANLKTAVFLGNLSRNRSWYKVTFKGEVVTVIYDKKNKNFITALPKDAFPLQLKDTFLPIDRPVVQYKSA